MLMFRVFKKPEKASVYLKLIIREIDTIGLQSIGIVTLISFFMGAVVAMQTAFNLTGPTTPMFLVGFATRQSVILEFSSTIMCLILAGKVGSRISSEIGTMRITEQIDALEIMGINSASYLILPKVVAAILIMPILVITSMFVAILGGYMVSSVFLDLIPTNVFLYGLKLDFKTFDIYYSLIKGEFFAFAITSIPAFYGYYAYGGALSVGKASLKAVVSSSIAILIMNYVITQFFLS